MRTASSAPAGPTPTPGDIFLIQFEIDPARKPLPVSWEPDGPGPDVGPVFPLHPNRRVTVRKLARGEGKFIRQSGGKGQYGHVVIELQPQRVGAGLNFLSEVAPAVIPPRFVELVIAGLSKLCAEASVAAYPLADLMVRIVDGSYNAEDSSELSFKMAAIFALKDAIRAAEPYVFDLGGDPEEPGDRPDGRPAVVVSRSDFDGSNEPVICVPLATRSQGSSYEVSIGQQPFLPKELWAYVRGIASFERRRLTQLLGRVSVEQLEEIKERLKYSLDL